jgi:bifunctional enzyme CysN/CysC
VTTSVEHRNRRQTTTRPPAETAGPTTAFISRTEREKANGHRPGILWFTGLPAAGKSTLASALGRLLFETGYQVVVLDGDSLRTGLNVNLSFSREDRSENVRRAGEVAALFAEAGFLAIVALIAPYRSDRERLRSRHAELYHEIYVSTPLQVCEARDPKGHYRNAREGALRDFTGVSAPYEHPLQPDLEIDTTHTAVEQSVQRLLEYVRKRFALENPLRRSSGIGC